VNFQAVGFKKALWPDFVKNEYIIEIVNGYSVILSKGIINISI
jgi:hypothetical protein